jgi:hypothetical protein
MVRGAWQRLGRQKWDVCPAVTEQRMTTRDVREDALEDWHMEMQLYYRIVRRATAVLFVLLTLAGQSASDIRTSRASGGWSSPTIWSPAGVPAYGDSVVIATGTSVTINVNTEDLALLTINSGGVLKGDGTGKWLSLAGGDGVDFLNNGRLDAAGTTAFTIVLADTSDWAGTGVFNCSFIDLNGTVLRFPTNNPILLNLAGDPDPFLNPGGVEPSPALTIVYCGQNLQDAASDPAIHYSNLTILNPSGVTLDADLSPENFTGDLTLAGGGVLVTSDGTGIYAITGPAGKSLTLSDSSRLVLAGAFSSASTFPSGFASVSCARQSTVEYQNQSFADQAVSTLPHYGSIEFSGGGRKIFASGTLSAAANWYNNSPGALVFDPAAVVVLNGTGGPQTMGGSEPLNFQNLTIQNSAGVVAAGPVTIAGILSLQSGVLTSGSNPVSIASSGAVVRTTGYINGVLAQYVPAGSPTLRYDIGDEAAYSPVMAHFNDVTTPGDVRIAVTPGEHPEILSSVIDPGHDVNRWWSVVSGGAVASSCDLSLNFVPSDLDAGAIPGNFTAGEYTGIDWAPRSVANATSAGISVNQCAIPGDVAVGESIHHTVSAEAGIHGTVSPAGNIPVVPGGSVRVVFQPEAGYHVDSVLVDDDEVDSTEAYTFDAVDGDHTVRVVFAINYYAIEAAGGPNGTVLPDDTVLVAYGGTQTFRIIPDTGYAVDSLVVDGVVRVPDTVWTFSGVTADHTLLAVFGELSYTITASAGPHGSIAPQELLRVEYGGSASFDITPDEGYHIDSVLVDGITMGDTSSWTFNDCSANHSIRAVFAVDRFLLVSSAGPNGNITPAGSMLADFGTSKSYLFHPLTGYHVDTVLVDGDESDSLTGYTFTNIGEEHTIYVTFAIDLFTIDAESGDNGWIDPSDTVYVEYGSTQVFHFYPDEGYCIDSLLVDGMRVPPDTVYSFMNVTRNHTVSVAFTLIRFRITAVAGPNGTIDPAGIVPMGYGTDCIVEITPGTGYHVDTLLVDGVRAPDTMEVEFDDIRSDHSVYVTFAIDRFSITASYGDNGRIMPEGTISTTYNGTVSFTFAPARGYHVETVLVDDEESDSISGFTFAGIDDYHTIRVEFAKNEYLINAIAGDNGSIDPSDEVTAEFGDTVAFNITPDDDYMIGSVIVDGIAVGRVASYAFPKVDTNHVIQVIFSPVDAASMRYRTFTYRDLVVKKGLKKKALTDYWEFELSNDNDSAIQDVNIRFTSEVIRFIESGKLVPSGSRKSWNLHGRLEPGESVVLKGRSKGGKAQMIDKYWLGPAKGLPYDTKIDADFEQGELPMPNAANIRDEAFAAGVFSETNGLVVGIPHLGGVQAGGVIRMLKGSDLYASLIDRSGMHVGPGRGLDVMTNGKSFTRELRSLPPAKHNNKLFADLLTLKFNIALSDFGMTEPGFGELVYADGTSPFNGRMVREIADFADSSMTYFSANRAAYHALDSVVAMLNAAFSGAIDTVSWGEEMVLTGTNMLGSVSFLNAAYQMPRRTHRVPQAVIPDETPSTYCLHQNYPNPFNPSTTISFDLPLASKVTVKIYNIIGQEVATLIDQEMMDAGTSEVEFIPGGCSSGVYFCRLVAQAVQDDDETSAPVEDRTPYVAVKKMMYLK